MKAFPIPVMDIEAAKKAQFKLVDEIHNEFVNDEFFQTGDVGLAGQTQFPEYTLKVERVLARYFGAESALLVRGAGTGAIRSVLNSCLKAGDKILVHDAPIYPTTNDIIKAMGLETVTFDYHRIEEIDAEMLKSVDFAIVQHSRQKPSDNYDFGYVIRTLKKLKPELVILTDDNYVAFKAPKIGSEHGADVSSFSCFKLLGPQGVGCLIGSRSVLDKVRKTMYSGGSKVQGSEAMDVLRSLVYAPVMLAIQKEQSDLIVNELNEGLDFVKEAYIVNAQSRVILVEFTKPIAKRVLEEANKLGASSYPVGSESRYEVPSLFYRVSGTFLKADPTLIDTTIRINPMRAGKDTVIRILKTAIKNATEEA